MSQIKTNIISFFKELKDYFKNKIKKNSLATNIWFFLIIFSVLILAFLWFFQIVFLGTYYKSYKTNELNTAAKELKADFINNDLNSLTDIAINNGVCIEIYGESPDKYTAKYFNQGCMEFGNTNFKVKKDFIESNLDKQQYNLVNNQFKNNTLIYALKLDSSTYAFINASLEPIDGTVQILQSQLLYVTLVVLILSFIIGYFISKKLSRPITQISKDAKLMADGNYDIKFSSNEDIYEINELVDTLNYTKSELAKMDELKRDLMANVSHDLKTPLTMIKAYAEMVRDLTYKDKNKREDNLNTIITETDRLNILVNDILDLSALQARGTTLHLEEFDLVDITTEIINKFSILTEKEGYNFKFIHPKKAMVKADKKRIYQVIYNLINNAINYTGDDKKVTVHIKSNDDTYLVEIKDSGKGINKDEIKFIWDKYYHSDKKHKRNEYGTGLGLSIVKNILQTHKCKYGVNSSIKGTTFYFEIKKSLK